MEQAGLPEYLDEKAASDRATFLFQQVQRQPYHHRVRTGHSALEDVDGLSDDAGKDGDDDGQSVTTWDSEEEERRMRQEWEDNIAQLNLVLQVMILPYFGKYFGRRWSYWAFTRYQRCGFTAAFFGLDWIWKPTTVVPDAAVALLQP